ncbi:DUF5977 domain-containing protein [Mucilaginibacter sp.]|uniref:DUF5977 domain-containing protein n=1 Tax=Mucilaginibacter sp. TaxID=1882438 RepID=UPI002618E628|nr:DUF5977 domain-containing protein [Mucilaginibacter sp.]MDB5127443.1 hypothetical protein [Mucilaginibacter sp.]
MKILDKREPANHTLEYNLLRISRILFLSILALLITFDKVSAQDDGYIPPSPTSISIIKASASNVNLFSGKSNVSIPIYTIKAGSISSSIGLKYIGGSGIKVQDISGEAGLGWSLLAGGTINKTKRVNDDASGGTNGYYTNPGVPYLLNTPGSTEFQKAFSNFGDGDLQPDIYNSTIGGRIIFDKDKQPHFTNEQGYKIVQSGNLSADHIWIIADAQGTKYYFGETVDAQERYILTAAGGSQSVSSEVSTWRLSKIVSKDGAYIKFDYEKSGTFSQFKYYSFVRTLQNGSSTWINSITSMPASSEELHLSKITTQNSSVEFLYKDRADFANSKAISEIKVLNAAGELLTKYVFETDYFKSTDPTPTLRLKLTALKQVSGDLNNVSSLAAFDYNEQENLPARNSEKFDFWGYYNNNTTGKYFLSEGANRTADPNKSQANILTGIRWPTGGLTKYSYEVNIYQFNGSEYLGGGLRIASVSQVNSDNSSLTTTYDYTSSSTVPKKTSGILHLLFDITKGYTKSYKNTSAGSDWQYYVENALPLTKAIDLDGVTVGYSQVTVTSPDQSSEVYYFQDYLHFPDETKHYSYVKYAFATPPKVTNFTLVNDQDNYNGFNSVTSNAVQRGLVTDKEIYNNSHTLIKAIHYKYDVYTGTAIPGAELFLQYTYIGSGDWATDHKDYYTASLYYERVMAARLIEVKEDNYFLPINPTVSSVTSSFEYKPAPYVTLMAKRTQKQADGTTLTENYNYPPDMIALGRDPNQVYAEMRDNNIISPVIETTTARDSNQISYLKVNYFKTPFYLYSPKTVETQVAQNASEVNINFDSYDESGNIVSQHSSGGSNTAYKWGHNNQFPVAKVINAYSQFSELNQNSTGIKTVTIYLGPTAGNYPNPTTANFLQRISGDIVLAFAPSVPSSASANFSYSLTGPANRSGSYSCSNGVCNLPAGNSLTFPNMPAGNYALSISGSTTFQSYTFSISINCTYLDQLRSVSSEKEFYYEGFEELTGAGVTADLIHTGRKSFNGSYSTAFTPPNTRKYIVQWWSFNNNKWNLNEQPFTQNLTLTGRIDDIRIYPADAIMTTYTYEPLIGMTSSTDTKGQTIYYEYDGLQRLQNVRDNNGNIITNHRYNLQGLVYWNVQKQGSFVKSCPAGTQSTVIYAVVEHTYSASTQAAADALAQADVNANGQAYANLNGSCQVLPYAIFEQTSVTGGATSTDQGYATYRLRLYSDQNFTVPYTATGNITVNYRVRTSTVVNNGTPTVTFNNYTITIASGASYVNAGQFSNGCGSVGGVSVIASESSVQNTAQAQNEAAQANLLPPGGGGNTTCVTQTLLVLEGIGYNSNVL